LKRKECPSYNLEAASDTCEAGNIIVMGLGAAATQQHTNDRRMASCKIIIPLVSVLDSSTSFLLRLILYKRKVPSNANVGNLAIRFKMPLDILNLSAHGVKIDNKEGSRWLYIPSRSITALWHWFNLLNKLKK